MMISVRDYPKRGYKFALNLQFFGLSFCVTYANLRFVKCPLDIENVVCEDVQTFLL